MSALALLSVVPRPWSSPVPILQGDITGGGITALLVTFLVASLFYAVTMHLAATFFLGEVPTQKAATVGPVPAVVSILLGRWGQESVAFVSEGLGVLIALALTLIADAMAISRVYDLAPKPTAALTLLHLAFSAALGIALGNLLGVL